MNTVHEGQGDVNRTLSLEVLQPGSEPTTLVSVPFPLSPMVQVTKRLPLLCKCKIQQNFDQIFFDGSAKWLPGIKAILHHFML